MGRFRKLAEEMGDIERLAWQEVWIVAEDCSAAIREMPTHKRRRVAVALTNELFESQNGICPLCNNLIDRSTLGAFHTDHIIPFYRGGGYERDNLQVAHPSCNMSKGNGVDVRDLVPYLERKAAELSE